MNKVMLSELYCHKSRLLGASVFLFFLFIIDSSSVRSQEKPITLMPRWKQGEKLKYEMIKTRRKNRNGKEVLHSTNRTDVEIEVLKAGKDGYLLRWTMGEIKFDDPKQSDMMAAFQMADLLLHGLQMTLEIDTEGTIEGVQNWKELKDLYTNVYGKMMDNVSTMLRRAGYDDAMIAKMRMQVASMFSTKEQIELSATREVQSFLLALGRTYSPTKPIEYEANLPNPLGGEPLPSKGVFSLKAFDKNSGRAVVALKQTIDPKEAARIMGTTLKDLSARLGKPMPDENMPEALTIEDHAESSVDATSGWLYSLKQTRTARIGERFQEDSLHIIRKSE